MQAIEPDTPKADSLRRLAIFAFFDKDGIVDDYVIYLLQAMQAHCARQIVMVNGSLTPESEARVQAVCDTLLYRANSGYDICAYKEAFLQAEDLDSYDEIVFYNQTVFGPVCNMATMFEAMAAQNLDFWGVSKHKGARSATWDNSVAIPPHLQSYFFAVRKEMFLSDAFAAYWENLPAIITYWDAVSKHEILFTEHFSALGFRWGSYLSTDDLEAYNDYLMLGMPLALLERGSPFLKRKSFLSPRTSYASVPQGYAAQQLYDAILTQTDYPISLIAQNITRTVPQAIIHDSLTLYFDPDSTGMQTAQNSADATRTLAVLWFAGDAMADALYRAAAALPSNAACIALFASEALQHAHAPALPPRCDCRCIGAQNGLAHLFGDLWQQTAGYDYLLYLNNALPLLLGEFADATTLYTAVDALAPAGCERILNARTDVGGLVPIQPTHQECLTLGLCWREAAPAVQAALAGYGITIPLGEADPGIAVRGNLFFARRSALAPLTNFAFDETHFAGLYPPSEYLIPLALQSSGYFMGRACSAAQAYNTLQNQQALLGVVNDIWATKRMIRSDQLLFRMECISRFYYERRFQMTLEQAFAAPLTIKQKVWICLQIILSPTAFAKLGKLLGRSDAPAPEPIDELE